MTGTGPTANWHVHYVNARGKLDDLKPHVEAALQDVYPRISKICEPPVVDILVEAVWNSSVIPERGHLGRGNEDLVTLWLAPEHPMLAENLGEPLARVIAHEMNHVLRFRSAGGSKTLGDLIVSEGLACQFVKELFGNAPEPWEQALSRSELGQFIPRATEHFESSADWRSQEIDISEWMFGTGALPRWLGYTLGYELVGQYLEDHPDLSASGLVDIPSTDFKPALAKLSA
ncbi:DUF2268 domain-containing putative Zn-dependent protease [Nisaea denitrificans]|uniref:DUF2268 domain-containing putative Zn-dependent protease n=1 Tax=Nisaea denitrificans TaxID=390877 RepID=UPI000408A660|nr:DUF2268 domain-containing putative Zn-dependent protease [Nisaea denitrificans]